MTQTLVILRPEPAATATRVLAEQAGWNAVVAPLFSVEPCGWQAPNSAQFDALLLTSANAIRHGSSAILDYADLPLYAVGASTAKAARNAGFIVHHTGERGAEMVADRLRADGRISILHLAGAHSSPFNQTGLTVTSLVVYESRPIIPAGLLETLNANAIVLLHSSRATRYFVRWCGEHEVDRSEVRLVAISVAALAAAGKGWKIAIAAEMPNDEAILAAAKSLGDGFAIR